MSSSGPLTRLAPQLRWATWIGAPAAAILWFVAPLVSGDRTLYLRDVINTHVLLRESLRVALRAGELPLIDPLRLCGAALAGNMNAVAFYPGNLLLLVGDTLWQLNLHFALHWMLALVGAFRLGRKWGLGPEGAAGCGAVFALSGYWFSQMNLFNAVVGVALAPWLWSALIEAGPGPAGRRHAAWSGILWGLALLGGDPILAALALAVGLALAAARHGRELRWGVLVLALGLGTVLAAPQIVETLRILDSSYRGHFGFPESRSGTRAPVTAIDLLLPFFFGRPDLLGVWGEDLFSGYEMLYFTLFPGLPALVLALVARRPLRREAGLLVVLGAVSFVLIYSGGTAIPHWIAKLPGASAFRYFEKLALVPMLGLALAAGAGLQRLAAGEGRRRAARVAGLLALPLLALWLGFGTDSEGAAALFRGAFGDLSDAPAWQDVRVRCAGLALFGLLTLAACLGGLALLRRRPRRLAWTILGLHVLSQSVILSPLVSTDDAAIYRRAPAIAAAIPRDHVLLQLGGLDPKRRLRAGELPERSHVALARRQHAELAAFAAVLDGRRVELAVSPEGLDPFVTQVLISAIDRFPDSRRIAIVRALGVGTVISARALDLEDPGAVRFVSERPSLGRTVRIYEVADPLPEAALAGSILRVPHVNAALEAIWAPGFDPARVAVVPGTGERRVGPPGTARIVESERQRLLVDVASEQGGVLVVRRSFLPIWEAKIDGRRAPTTIAQVARLAVEVPPGAHRVELSVTREPLLLSLVAAMGALTGLVLLARSRISLPRGEGGATPAPASTPGEP